jgi:hypothetical protein
MGSKRESERDKSIFLGQNPQAATRLPKVTSKLGNKSSNSRISITRFCAKACVPHHKNNKYIKNRGTSAKKNNVSKGFMYSSFDLHFMTMVITHAEQGGMISQLHFLLNKAFKDNLNSKWLLAGDCVLTPSGQKKSV